MRLMAPVQVVALRLEFERPVGEPRPDEHIVGVVKLGELAGASVSHVILDLKYGRRAAGEVLEEIGREVLPRLGKGGLTPPLEAATAS